MSLFKCKMCGGDLNVPEGVTTAECDYCGTKQTVPKSMDPNMQNLFNRANTLRMRAEFDKASEIYEKIVQIDNTQSDAYWGLILCKYGIEYVDDPATFTKIPTCHRASFDSIISDDDYKSAIENADMLQKVIYEEQAKEIERIQKEILALAQKEETYDVFICYKETDETGKRTQDSVIANDIYYQLTNEGFKVFYAAITLEGKLGSAYEPIIFAALNSSKVMLSIGTKAEYFNAVWVKNEWSRFLKIIQNDRTKILIPCYRDMDAYDLPQEFAHLQAQDMSKIGFINDVVRGIKKVIVKEDEKATTIIRETVVAPQPQDNSKNQLVLEGGVLYTGETFANVPHGEGRAEYANGDVYEGAWNRGQREGQGKLTCKNGDIYEGVFEKDKIKKGKSISHLGDEFEGTFYDDGRPRSGKGCVGLDDDKNGFRIYTGEVSLGKEHGFGERLYDDCIYEGYFKMGKREGQGKLTWIGEKSGNWEGEFKDDAPWNGSGIKYYDDSFYIGALVEGKRHGQGKIVWNEGGEWEGEFKNDKRYNGYGTVRYLDSVYIGPIVNGNNEGQAKLIWNDGGEWEGEFKNDKRYNGYGTDRFNDAVYIGQYVDGKMHGQGKIVWNEGGEWQGEFKEGKRWNGNGVNRYQDGYYKGEMIEGKRQGRGMYVWTKGGRWEGEFKDDVRWNGGGTVWFSNDYVNDNVKTVRGKDKTSGCYVATCVYGSYDCPQVWTLRRYRDNTLGATWYGRAFIRTYYAISPTIVKWFGNTKWFKKMWKGKLDRMVSKLQEKGVEDTPYEDKNW